jgi:pyrroloquinoline quinone (PQQ) biosynthesis protein C
VSQHPAARRIGTVGRPLPHAALRIADDGEVQVRGARMLGYLGEAPLADEWVADERGGGDEWLGTGDLGHFEDGFLVLHGRRKHQFITAYGRNVNPEWVEAELVQQGPIAQAWVHGEALAENLAVLVPRRADCSDAELDAAVAAANAGLPDYARAGRWLRAEAPFTPATAFSPPTGACAARPSRRTTCRAAAPTAPRLLRDLHLLQRRERHMSFFQQLQDQTAAERETLFAAPIIQQALAGKVALPSYIAFLTEAYHHVSHTVPLLMACGARLPARLEWLRGAIAEYIDEEYGHQEWILNDLAACGADPEAVRRSQPALPTELMVAYVYDRIARHNPVSFFGMVNVLEGTSIALATRAAGSIRSSLGLPPEAFSYLNSHGSLDLEHMDFFATLMNRLDEDDDRAAVVHTARVVYRLYGDIFRSLPLAA